MNKELFNVLYLSEDAKQRRKSLKPLEQKVIGTLAAGNLFSVRIQGLASENNRLLNHTMNRAYIVTQSIKKLSSEYKRTRPESKGFPRLSDHQACGSLTI